MGNDGPARRREIEESTAARLAEIVAAAERAAKRVIDEAEEEARARIADAHEEAERIVTARLAGLGDLTDEINAQAEALARQAQALQGALARAKAEISDAGAPGGAPAMGRREPGQPTEPAPSKPVGPSLTVVGGVHEEPEPEPDERRLHDTAERNGRDAAEHDGRDEAPREEPAAAETRHAPPAPSQDFAEEISLDGGSPAGARLLATQMAVSGSSRAEIESRLRSGFKISDTRAILDAILGPEN